MLNPNIIGNIDGASKEIIKKEEELEEKEKENKKIKIKKKKMRGRSKIGRREHAKELVNDLKNIIKSREHVNIKIR